MKKNGVAVIFWFIVYGRQSREWRVESGEWRVESGEGRGEREEVRELLYYSTTQLFY